MQDSFPTRHSAHIAGTASEDGELHAEKLFRILAKIAHEQAQVTGQPRQVVVELRVGEEFACGGLVRVELGGSGFEVRANVAPLVEQRSEERRVGKECRSRWSPYH